MPRIKCLTGTGRGIDDGRDHRWRATRAPGQWCRPTGRGLPNPMAVATLSPVRATLRRSRRADPRALIGVFITLAALAGSVAFWVGSSDARPVLVATRDLAVGSNLRSADLGGAYVRMDDALYRAALPADMLDMLVGRQLGEPVHAQQVLV